MPIGRVEIVQPIEAVVIVLGISLTGVISLRRSVGVDGHLGREITRRTFRFLKHGYPGNAPFVGVVPFIADASDLVLHIAPIPKVRICNP
jgi:hypothetical protein